MAVGKRLRFEVFKRDGFACQYCGRTPPQVTLEADHVVPESTGGPTVAENLVTSCFDCNRGKADIPLTSVPSPLSEVMAEAAEKREQLEAYGEFLKEGRLAEDARIEELGLRWYNEFALRGQKNKYVFNTTRAASVRTFLRKLPFPEVEEAFEIAVSKVSAHAGSDDKRWRYFCGVCWRMIRQAEGE